MSEHYLDQCICGHLHSFDGCCTVCVSCKYTPSDHTMTEPARSFCYHERTDEDGICRACGTDCRGTHHPTPLNETRTEAGDGDDPAIVNLLQWNEEKAQRISALTAQLHDTEAEIERLKAPISDEEEHLWAQELTAEQTWAFSKGSIYNILKARAALSGGKP